MLKNCFMDIKKKYTAFAVMVLMLMGLNVNAQTMSPLNTYVQKVRIGLVDEFFDRFNGKTSHPDIPITNDDSRKNNLLMLLDLSQFTSKNDPHFAEASDMMDKAIKDSIHINFSDTTWAAIAHCKGTLDSKSIKFDLFLTVQKRTRNMLKWTIARADGSIFNITPRNDNDKIMLNPDDHETNFISLKRMTAEQPFNIEKFMSRGFNYEATSVFTYLVYSGKLKIDYVDDLEFVFTQIPGYIFHIKYFEREKNNAGWLISNFYKSTKENTNAFLGMLHSHAIIDDVSTSVDPNKEGEKNRETVGEKDTLATKNYKEMFMKRRYEKIGQLCDYINFMQSKDTIRSQSVYQNKMIALFADSTKVQLRYSRKSKNCVVSVPELCKMIIHKSIKVVTIDSLCVPNWDDKINTLTPDINRVELSSSIYSFKQLQESDNLAVSNYSQILYAYKEETEDGVEWLPIFGDIVVNVK